MSGFVLEYGNSQGRYHVSLDMSQDEVFVYHGMGAEPTKYTLTEFEIQCPTIVTDMVKDGVLRLK